MKRFIALLCFCVFLVGSAMCEEALPPENINTEQELVPEEIAVEETFEEEIPPVTEEDPPIESPPAEEPPAEEPPIEEPPVAPEPEPEPAPAPEPEPIPDELPSETVSPQVVQAPPEPTPAPIQEEPPVVESTEIIIPEEVVQIDDDNWGYVDDEILPREVHITFLKEPQYFGDETVLAATLVNFKFEDNYTIYWQYCIDPNAESIEWINIEGEHSQVYSFIITEDNYLYGYRVLVKVEE